MLTKEKIIGLLRENYDYRVSEFGVKKIGLFGSYAIRVAFGLPV